MRLTTCFMAALGKNEDSFHCIKDMGYPKPNDFVDDKEYQKAFDKWVEESKVLPEGSCDEHEFGTKQGT